MSASELFEPASVAVDSPRLTWLKRHNLSIGQLPDGTRFCVGRHAIGYGSTHLEAEQQCAEAEDITHWEAEEFTKAGVVLPTVIAEENW